MNVECSSAYDAVYLVGNGYNLGSDFVHVDFVEVAHIEGDINNFGDVAYIVDINFAAVYFENLALNVVNL